MVYLHQAELDTLRRERNESQEERGQLRRELKESVAALRAIESKTDYHTIPDVVGMRNIARKALKFCRTCGQPATCLGAYEGRTREEYACDTCCGHGNEDGHCERLDAGEGG